MKSTFLVIAIFFSFSFSIAQDIKPKLEAPGKFFIQLGAGYNFRSGIGRFSQMAENGDGSNTYTSIPGSYGKGLNISLGGGYMLSPNLGVDLSLSNLFGGGNFTHNVYLDNVYNYTDKQTIKYSANMFRVNPSVFVITELKKNTSVYAKFGMVYGWASAKWNMDENVVYQSGGTSHGIFEWKISGGTGLGYTSSIGIQIKTQNPAESFYIELTHISQGAVFKKGTKTRSEINGKSNLSSLNTSQKEFVYGNSEISDPCTNQNPNQDPNEPVQYLKYKSNFDSFGFNIGYIIRIR